jgi:competence protein ComEC
MRLSARRSFAAAAAMLALSLTLVAGTSALDSHSLTSKISFVDVGQGDGVAMRIGGKVILSDAGQFNVEKVDAALRALGAKTTIDVVILSHPHSDHVKNVIALVNTYHWKVGIAVLNHSAYWRATPTNKAVLAALKSAGADVKYVVAGDRFDWGGADWEILNPVAGKYEDPYSSANSSVAYLLRVRKVNVLFTGDIGPAVAEKVADRWTEEGLGRVGIFLATHHGSAEGSNQKLLDAIHPRWAVLSTGPNGFHHPTAAAIGRLEGSGASIWCTDVNGTVTATITTRSAVRWQASAQKKPWWSAATHSETGSCVGH